ncbi:ABC transporter substrate-binding protein [Aliikangiella sp. IMCC44632]
MLQAKGGQAILALAKILKSARLSCFLLFVSSALPLVNAAQASGPTQSNINIAYFTEDPPSIDPLSQSFDPDSYSVIAQIFDPLLYLDLKGQLQPALASRWEQLSETRWLFHLRQNVKFHNGEVFNAKAVKFTFDYVLNPKNRTGNRWIFNTLKNTYLVKGQPYQIIFETTAPDGMFLNRLHLFSSICPPNYIKKHGIEHFQRKPIGTGPFKFKQWHPQKSITLERNSNYWQQNKPYLDQVTFTMTPKSNWLAGFKAGKIDFIPNLSGNKTTSLLSLTQGDARIIKKNILASYMILLNDKGPLKNLNLRRAINFATNKQDIIKFADFGNALPLGSLGKRGEFGADDSIPVYEYSPQTARKLIQQSNLTLPIKLTALVADLAEPTAKIIKRNLASVGIQLDTTVVSRSEWTKQVVVYKIRTGKRPDYDMVISLVDNPIYHLGFHAGLFFHSESPWSQISSAEFDKKLQAVMQIAEQDKHLEALQSLDWYIHQQALLLFTTQKQVTAAVRNTYSINDFSLSGHLNYQILSDAQVSNEQ